MMLLPHLPPTTTHRVSDLAETAGDRLVRREGGELGRVPAAALGPVSPTHPVLGQHRLCHTEELISGIRHQGERKIFKKSK